MEDIEVLLEGIKGGRLNVLSSKKKELGKNRTKYTIVVTDTAIIEKSENNNRSKKKATREKPKEKVVIEKKETRKEKPLPVPPMPPMAEIKSIGGY